jgi:PKD domain-containing protein
MSETVRRGRTARRVLAGMTALAWLSGCSSNPASTQPSTPATTTTPPATTTPAAPSQPPSTAAADTCTYTLSTTSQSIIGEGGTFSFNVTRTTGTCGWTATADSWISVSPSSGNGSADVTATVGRNGSPARTGAITISWTSAADGPKSARVTVSQNDIVPRLTAGAIATEPQGAGVASVTAFAFSLSSNPSGGIPPYSYSWDFGDGASGTGTAPTHTYSQTGGYRAVLTVSDLRGVTATTQMTIPVDTVTGSWSALINGAVEPKIDLAQSSGSVAASIDTLVTSGPRKASGSGTLTHPRKLEVRLVFDAGFSVTYTGQLDALLTTWTGTVTGYAGCPCQFRAGKISN